MTSVDAYQYQLKWNSHTTRLNESVASLLRSERFTDVVLCTMDGSQIPAHKFILSSCSAYLCGLFEAQSTVTYTGGMMYVVLPSEISKKTLKILVEYMYKGEITFSNEDMGAVLKAGEALKIPGICREDIQKEITETVDLEQVRKKTPRSKPVEYIKIVSKPTPSINPIIPSISDLSQDYDQANMEIKVELDTEHKEGEVSDSDPLEDRGEMDAESITDNNHHNPKKRRRRHSSSSDSRQKKYMLLRCEPCEMYFPGYDIYMDHVHEHNETVQESSYLKQGTSLQVLETPTEDPEKETVVAPQTQLLETQDIVSKDEFYAELNKYYQCQSQLSTKPEWTKQRINQIIDLIEKHNYPTTTQRTSQQYHYARKYKVVYKGDEKILVPQGKKSNSNGKQILPSEEYYDCILNLHLSTGHGGRDKIIRAVKPLYIVPKFVISIFLHLCKVCKSKRIGKKTSRTPVIANVFNQEQQTVPRDILDVIYDPKDCESSINNANT